MKHKPSFFPLLPNLLAVLLLAPSAGWAQQRLDVTLVPDGTVRVSWIDPSGGLRLENSPVIGPGALWEPVPGAPVVSGAQRALQLSVGERTRFFRLRQSGPVVTTVLETSPSAGESGVAATRETIFRFSSPLADDIVLDSDDLMAEFGGRRLLTRAEISSDRRTATLFYLELLPASARVRVTLDGTSLRDAAGLPPDLDGDGQPGGRRVLDFDTAGVTALKGTAVIGRVFASARNPDGSSKPIENVTVTVVGAEETLRTTTDVTGAFKLDPAPAGRFFVNVDGRTAVGSRWPGGATIRLSARRGRRSRGERTIWRADPVRFSCP